MIRSIRLMTASVAALSGIAAPAMAQSFPAATTLTAASSAALLDVVIALDGAKTALHNQVPASGKAPPVYSVTKKVPSYSKTQTFGLLTMNATAKTLSSTASAVSTAGGGLTSTAAGSVGTLSAVFSSPLGNALSVNASKITSTASFAATKAGGRTPTASTSIGKLDIDGTGLGIGKLHFAGIPKVGQVLYHNGDNSIVIMLNKQKTTKVAGKATSISVDAVSVHIDGYNVAGHSLSGDVVVAASMAN